MIWLALLLCLGQSAQASEEITVWGEPALRQARSALVRKMEDLGYRSVDKPGGRVLFKPPRRWLGRAWFEADGTLRFLRPVVAWKTAEGVQWQAVDAAPFERTPAGMATTGGSAAAAGAAALWVLPSERLLRPERERVERAAAAELQAYVRIVRETAFREELRVLPDRLDAAWREGTPLQPSLPTLSDPVSRKVAILTFWATRTDTREGNAMAEAVAAWIRGTLQGTSHAITEEEAAAAESEAGGRTLDVF
ncbi:MAG: hypothetical protein ACI8PZ_002211 [Myxococcota bacterium]|jgi:hypothetical protein